MILSRNDFSFQGYTQAKEKPQWTAWQIKKWEREADEQTWIEYSELSGESNDFLQVEPMRVITYHKVKGKK
jgi:hypothetical protein